MRKDTRNKEYDEQDYPEGTLGWKVNKKLSAVEEHPLKSGTVCLGFATILLLPAIIEILYYSMNIHGPLLTWRAGIEPYNLAQWHMVVYVVVLLMFVSFFLYFGTRLVWKGLINARSTRVP